MQCNYFKDHEKDIEAYKRDPSYLLFQRLEDIPLYSCHAGMFEYEPTEEEKLNYCAMDFLHCPRLYARTFKK